MEIFHLAMNIFGPLADSRGQNEPEPYFLVNESHLDLLFGMFVYTLTEFIILKEIVNRMSWSPKSHIHKGASKIIHMSIETFWSNDFISLLLIDNHSTIRSSSSLPFFQMWILAESPSLFYWLGKPARLNKQPSQQEVQQYPVESHKDVYCRIGQLIQANHFLNRLRPGRARSQSAIMKTGKIQFKTCVSSLCSILLLVKFIQFG